MLTFRADAPRGIVHRKKRRQGTDEEAMKLTSRFHGARRRCGLRHPGACASLSVASHHHHRAVPGGRPSDTLARILGDRMRISLGQPVFVENRHRRRRAASGSCAPRSPRRTATRSASATGPAMWAPARCIRLPTTRCWISQPIARDQRHAADDRRQERVAAAERERADRVAQGESRQGSAATVGAGSGAHVACSTLRRRPAPVSSSCRIAAVRRSCRICSRARSTCSAPRPRRRSRSCAAAR